MGENPCCILAQLTNPLRWRLVLAFFWSRAPRLMFYFRRSPNYKEGQKEPRKRCCSTNKLQCWLVFFRVLPVSDIHSELWLSYCTLNSCSVCCCKHHGSFISFRQNLFLFASKFPIRIVWRERLKLEKQNGIGVLF